MIKSKIDIIRSPHPRHTSIRVYTIYLRKRRERAFISKPNDITKAGYINPILQKLKSDNNYYTELNIYNILMCRNNVGGYNDFLSSNVKINDIHIFS